MVAVLVVFFPIAINTIAGMRSVPHELYDLMNSLQASRWQIARKLEWPAALPVILAGLKVGATLAVIGALVGEFVQPKSQGLGYLLVTARYQLLMQDDASAEADSNTVIADIGARTMDVHVLRHGNMVHTREYAIGGSQLTADIQKAYGLGYDEAERQKCGGIATAGYDEMVMQPFVSNLAQELRGALQIYQAKEEGSAIGQVLLVGGCANLAGISGRIEQQLTLPVKVWSPFARMQFAKQVHVERLREQSPALAVACGLALWGYL